MTENEITELAIKIADNSRVGRRILEDTGNYRDAVESVVEQLRRYGLAPSKELIDFISKKAKSGTSVRDLLGVFGIKVIRMSSQG